MKYLQASVIAFLPSFGLSGMEFDLVNQTVPVRLSQIGCLEL